MEITWKTIGQRCVGLTKKGTQCRLPASAIAGGLASCPYHINQAVKRFQEVSSNPENQEFKSVFDNARNDSEYY